MAPLHSFFKRASEENSDSSRVKIGSLNIPIYALIGVCFSVAVLLVLVIWLTVSRLRKRSKRDREDKREAEFLTVKGVIKDSYVDHNIFLTFCIILTLVLRSLGMMHNEFSRNKITASIIMPNKTIIRPDATREQIYSFYEEQGNIPRPFAPFSFALNAGHSSSPPPSTEVKDNRMSTQSFSASAARFPSLSPTRVDSQYSTRDSIADSFFGHGRSASALSAGTRLSVFSTGSAANTESLSTTIGVQQRTVRQIFTPILPDELLLNIGEQVSILRSFDDGWCVVARPKLHEIQGEAELGAVPAWCFVKPLKGLRSERPIRSSSLGVTVQVDNEEKPRNDVISWSNF